MFRLRRQWVPHLEMNPRPVVKKEKAATFHGHQLPAYSAPEWSLARTGPWLLLLSLAARIRLPMTCDLNPTHYHAEDGGVVFLRNTSIRAQSDICLSILAICNVQSQHFETSLHTPDLTFVVDFPAIRDQEFSLESLPRITVK